MVKVLDFAGGTVVHINAGIAGLMCASVLGKRKDIGTAPHNMVLTFIGASLLWVGWFGFNAGSAVDRRHAGRHGDDGDPDRHRGRRLHLDVRRVDRIAASRPSSASAPARSPASSPSPRRRASSVRSARWCIGVAAGVVCYWGVTGLKHMLGYDDALDAFGVHGVGGIVGALLTGVFAVEQYGGTAGLLEGNAGQVINQIKASSIVIVYDAVVSLIILKIIDASSACASPTRSSAKASTSPCTARPCTVATRDNGWGGYPAPPRPSGGLGRKTGASLFFGGPLRRLRFEA